MKVQWMAKLAALILALAMMISTAATAEAADSQKLDTYYSLAVNYIGREDYDKAMEYLDAALGYCDESANTELCADIHLKKGCVFTMQADYPQALTELDSAAADTVARGESEELQADLTSATYMPEGSLGLQWVERLEKLDKKELDVPERPEPPDIASLLVGWYDHLTNPAGVETHVEGYTPVSDVLPE